LKEDIKANNGHLDTGIFGTQFFFEVLSENGMHDLAYEAMNKKEEPATDVGWHWVQPLPGNTGIPAVRTITRCLAEDWFGITVNWQE
jgi:hypothetical protein